MKNPQSTGPNYWRFTDTEGVRRIVGHGRGVQTTHYVVCRECYLAGNDAHAICFHGGKGSKAWTIKLDTNLVVGQGGTIAHKLSESEAIMALSQ